MKSLISILFLISITNIYSQINGHPLTYDDFDTLDVNNIQLITSNVGNCSPTKWLELLPNSPGYGKTIIYDHGPWVVGKVNGEPVLSIIQWWKGWNYSPGPIIDGQAAMLIHPEDSLKYRAYKITQGDDNSNPDYAEWPVDYGAPVNSNGEPLIKGNQTIWSAYNSLDSTANITSSSWSSPLTNYPIEIHQTVYARNGFEADTVDIFSNVVFMEWEIINKSENTIDSTYFGFWSDIDFNGALENNPGVDTINQLGYCWSGTENIYDSLYPAVGYVLLFGPAVPAEGEAATFKGRNLPDHKNLQLNAFRGIADDSILYDTLVAPVHSLVEAQYVARGLTTDGNPIFNPVNNQLTTFPFSGDPVTNEGWVYNGYTSGGAGMVFFSGPFTLAPSDTQWAMIAITPGLGSNRFKSISQMRKKAELLLTLPYDSLAFGSLDYPITDVKNEGTNIIPDFKLYQNYPNPFNPSTTIKFNLPSPYQGEGPGVRSRIVTLKVYDILGREVTTLINEEIQPGVYEVNFDASGLSSGIYFYKLNAGNYIKTKKMILLR